MRAFIIGAGCSPEPVVVYFPGDGVPGGSDENAVFLPAPPTINNVEAWLGAPHTGTWASQANYGLDDQAYEEADNYDGHPEYTQDYR